MQKKPYVNIRQEPQQLHKSKHHCRKKGKHHEQTSQTELQKNPEQRKILGRTRPIKVDHVLH